MIFKTRAVLPRGSGQRMRARRRFTYSHSLGCSLMTVGSTALVSNWGAFFAAKTLGDPHPRAVAAWIGHPLKGPWSDHLLGQDLHRRPAPADAARQLRRAYAALLFLPEIVLDYAVFQRGIAYCYQASPRTEHLNSLPQRRFQVLQFVVDGDAQCLEGAGGRVDLATPSSQGLFDDPDEVKRGGDGAAGDNVVGDLAAGPLLSVFKDQAR